MEGQKKVKVAELLQNSQMIRGLNAPSPSTVQRQEPPQPKVVVEKVAPISDTPSHGVPRASVIINNLRVEAVLGGGSTVCIVSLKLVEMLGITELEPTNQSQVMADGRRTFALGVVRNLKIIIANKNYMTTDACVFDEPGYDLLLNRMALAKLRVGTDWGTNFWYIKSDIGTIQSPSIITKLS